MANEQKKNPSVKQSNTSLYLEPGLKAKIKEHAEANGRTMTSEIRWIVAKAFNQIEADENE